jgi:hypothetical protein
MPPTATEIFGSDGGVEDSLSGGLARRRKFWVNTGNELEARKAVGLPRRGDLHPGEPTLIATNISIRRLGGRDDANGLNAVSEATVLYGEVGAPMGVLTKEVQPAGVKHTVITVGTESVEIGQAVQDNGDDVTGQTFNNGRPASRLVGRETAEVYDFRPEAYDVPYSTLRLYSGDCCMNSDTIALPPPLGTTQPIQLVPKTALYVGYRVEARPDAKLIVHQLILSEDGFNIYWGVPDATGRIIANGTAQIYRTRPFGGLW